MAAIESYNFDCFCEKQRLVVKRSKKSNHIFIQREDSEQNLENYKKNIHHADRGNQTKN